jgi:phosphate transport system permease protein
MHPALPQQPVTRGPRTPRFGQRRSSMGDRIFAGSARGAALIVLALLGAVIVLLFIDARIAIQEYGLSFIYTTTWDPVFREFGAAGFIYGTLVTSFIGLLLATPIAAGAAIFIVEYAPDWLRKPISFTVEMLAAIPSIIYGLWGFFVLAPIMRDHVEPLLRDYVGPIPIIGALFQGSIFGKDLLTAGVILSIMILPTIMAVSREVVMTVPATQREGMLAIGATKWEMIRHAVLPYAKAGIAGAAILGLARALGETMAVTMVIGNSTSDIRASLFTPGYTMASSIANQFREADSSIYFSAVVNIGLVLLLISAIVNIIARIFIWSFSRGAGDTRL